ncbi:MAG: hypothetical protein RBT42_07680 [Aquabacterium sp.]|jgi:hypothetical protein|uniref:hypothetical protein n=1 Tax=Aquabacterium sp. TaxID=1872578 RepID=UPI002A36DBB2|nr:hypothetical protein [Aquabacterium sp.]MDX9843623.1 hypothetical protein [Aquabacterium sp.]
MARRRAFTPGTHRYAVAEALSGGQDLSFEQLVSVAQVASERATNGGIKSALNGLSAAGFAEHDHETRTWSLTLAGLARWDEEHSGPASTQTTSAHLAQPVTDVNLLVRNVSRAAIVPSPVNRLPFTPRDGAMDFAQHPRISGPWRIWPDGRRERIDQPTTTGHLA